MRRSHSPGVIRPPRVDLPAAGVGIASQKPFLYQRPFQLTCAHDRSVIDVTVLGSLAKRFHAVRQASRIAS